MRSLFLLAVKLNLLKGRRFVVTACIVAILHKRNISLHTVFLLQFIYSLYQRKCTYYRICRRKYKLYSSKEFCFMYLF